MARLISLLCLAALASAGPRLSADVADVSKSPASAAADSPIELSAILGPGLPRDVAFDDAGNIYVVGSGDPERFPVTTRLGEGRAFLVKLDATGSNILFSTFFDSEWSLSSVAVGPDRAPIVAGSTGVGAVVAKVSADGSELLFSRMLGLGSVSDLALDRSGEIYVVGSTRAGDRFPATANFLQDLSGDLDEGVLLVSDDQGASWRRSDNGLISEPFAQVAADPNVPGLLYVAGRRGLYRSIDGGAGWTPSLVPGPASRRWTASGLRQSRRASPTPSIRSGSIRRPTEVRPGTNCRIETFVQRTSLSIPKRPAGSSRSETT